MKLTRPYFLNVSTVFDNRTDTQALYIQMDKCKELLQMVSYPPFPTATRAHVLL